ncbi:2-thiouracil desulfurase family protein [Yinghuangia aomiensis]
MHRVLVSRCLLGERVRLLDGQAAAAYPLLAAWAAEERVVPVCPEVEGGLPTPPPTGGDPRRPRAPRCWTGVCRWSRSTAATSPRLSSPAPNAASTWPPGTASASPS